MHHNFQIGQLYNRRKDVHGRFGGSHQSGISPSASFPYIFLFTGKSGEKYGYTDHWDDNGVFIMSGEGRVGDMAFIKGNKAVRDHLKNGRDLLLFEGHTKGLCRFVGEFACASYEYQDSKDRNGDTRKSLFFHLVNVDEEQVQESIFTEELNVEVDLATLKARAYEAAQGAISVPAKKGRQSYYKRSKAVKDYVLKRANGICECCDKEAPFLKKSGEPYLEPHHIRKLSDNGFDHPAWVAAITPNCHREIHHGQNGNIINENLAARTKAKEVG